LPQISNRSELEMIAAVLAGEIQVYHELIRPYERSVYVMAFSYMKNREDAEDVAQEAFLRAFRKLASFRAVRRQLFFPLNDNQIFR
jgi:RNA polymerase sigma-70 factor (ECF subfamily)